MGSAVGDLVEEADEDVEEAGVDDLAVVDPISEAMNELPTIPPLEREVEVEVECPTITHRR